RHARSLLRFPPQWHAPFLDGIPNLHVRVLSAAFHPWMCFLSIQLQIYLNCRTGPAFVLAFFPHAFPNAAPVVFPAAPVYLLSQRRMRTERYQACRFLALCRLCETCRIYLGGVVLP